MNFIRREVFRSYTRTFCFENALHLLIHCNRRTLSQSYPTLVDANLLYFHCSHACDSVSTC
jgi:hypothetical protein